MDLELKLDRQRATSLLQAIGALVGMAGFAGGLAHVTGDSWVPVLRGAGQAMLAALVGFSVMGAVIALAHMLTRHRPANPPGDDWRKTGPRTLARYPIVYDDEGNEVDRWTELEFNEYLSAVLDEDSAVGLNQRDASSFGHDRDKLNALADWLVARGWWEYRNGVDNGNGGRWLVDSGIVLGQWNDER